MPCRDDGYEEQERAEQNKRHHEVTEYLCTVLGQLEAAGIIKDYGSAAILSWWKKHKAEDAAREEREKKAKAKVVLKLQSDIANMQAELKKITG